MLWHCINDIDLNGQCDEYQDQGCTDENAVNYIPELNENDGLVFIYQIVLILMHVTIIHQR